VKKAQQPKISIPEFRKLLGGMAESLSDAEIQKLMDWEDRLADVFFDWWLRRRNFPPEVAE
jgi:hypothetical protein